MTFETDQTLDNPRFDSSSSYNQTVMIVADHTAEDVLKAMKGVETVSIDALNIVLDKNALSEAIRMQAIMNLAEEYRASMLSKHMPEQGIS